jgi:hypothetical protein
MCPRNESCPAICGSAWFSSRRALRVPHRDDVDVPVEYVGNADNPARPERAGEFRRNCGCRLNLGVGETLAAEYSEIEKKESGTSRRKERKGTSEIPASQDSVSSELRL